MTFAQRINGYLRKVPAWPIYVLAPILPAWWYYQALNNQLGADPVKTLEHSIGLLGLKFLIVALAITPLRDHTKISLIKYRRAIGVSAFFLICAHLFVWLYYDVQYLSEVWKGIVKRPYITIGMAALVLMIPVAATSNNLSIRKMGPIQWKRWHYLTYPAILLGGIHFVMLRKTYQVQPLVYLTLILLLLALRIRWNRANTGRAMPK
jgi:methionine sulfoxide reductase heme-binding subunit